MTRKRIVLGVFLSLLVLTSAQAQDIQKDSASENAASQKALADTLQAFSSEIATINPPVNQAEKDARFEEIGEYKNYAPMGYATPSIERTGREEIGRETNFATSLQQDANAYQAQKDARLKEIWKYSGYFILGYDIPSVERTDGEKMELKRDFAISLQGKRTIYLHSKPLLDRIKFGIDLSSDLKYAKLKLNNTEQNNSTGTGSLYPEDFFSGEDNTEPDIHKFEFGLHVGPNISVNPWNHLIVSAYFHAIPSVSFLMQNDIFSYGIGCPLSAGISVSYKRIAVGLERYWSKIKYSQCGDTDPEEVSNSLFSTSKFKLKESTFRFYIALKM